MQQSVAGFLILQALRQIIESCWKRIDLMFNLCVSEQIDSSAQNNSYTDLEDKINLKYRKQTQQNLLEKEIYFQKERAYNGKSD